MKTDRNRDSRSQNLFKQSRRLQRRRRHDLQRDYLKRRLLFLESILEAHGDLPEGWLGLYPELSGVVPRKNDVDLLWLLNEELGRWFFLLRGPSQAAKGIDAAWPTWKQREDRFSIDLICMATSAADYEFLGSMPRATTFRRRAWPP